MSFKNRTLYIPAPASMDMSKKHKKLLKEKTCEHTPAREPVNHGKSIGTCVDCNSLISQKLNVGGCDGGDLDICHICYATYFQFPMETLDCGCVLIDWKYGDKLIRLCDLHRFTLTPMIVMSDITGGE